MTAPLASPLFPSWQCSAIGPPGCSFRTSTAGVHRSAGITRLHRSRPLPTSVIATSPVMYSRPSPGAQPRRCGSLRFLHQPLDARRPLSPRRIDRLHVPALHRPYWLHPLWRDDHPRLSSRGRNRFTLAHYGSHRSPTQASTVRLPDTIAKSATCCRLLHGRSFQSTRLVRLGLTHRRAQRRREMLVNWMFLREQLGVWLSGLCYSSASLRPQRSPREMLQHFAGSDRRYNQKNEETDIRHGKTPDAVVNTR